MNEFLLPPVHYIESTTTMSFSINSPEGLQAFMNVTAESLASFCGLSGLAWQASKYSAGRDGCALTIVVPAQGRNDVVEASAFYSAVIWRGAVGGLDHDGRHGELCRVHGKALD